MSALSLYVLTDRYRELSRLGTDEELSEIERQAIINTLDGMGGEITEKTESIAGYIVYLQRLAAAAAERERDLHQRAHRIKERAEWLKEYVRRSLEKVGIRKIESPEFTVTRVANPPSVEIIDESEVPDEYRAAPHPMIEAVLNAIRAEQPRWAPQAGDDEPLVVSANDLRRILRAHLPKPEIDKRRVARALKLAHDEHERAVEEARRRGYEPLPQFKNPVPGCRLRQSERINIHS
jgi:hypothetical protein